MIRFIPHILSFASVLIVAGVLSAMAFLAMLRLDTYLGLKQSEVRNQAIDGCAAVSRNTFTTGSELQNSVISDINQAPYQKCLELKNIQ